MLRPGELERLSMALDEPLKALEEQIMEDIVRRIQINGEITRATDWQINRLRELGMAKSDIEHAIQQHLSFTDEQMCELYEGALRSGYERDRSTYLKQGADILPFEENAVLQQAISAVAEQTRGELKNISQSLGFAVKQTGGGLKFTSAAEFYQKTLDEAVMGISSGAFDYNTVLKRAVTEMTNSGLRTVDYATGRSNRADVAVRRAVMTGVSQLTAKVNEENARELDTEYFEVSWHGGARPSHQEWQGRVFSKEELETICGLGTVTGLCGANCYHDYYPFIPGVSERTYTDEELESMNAEENVPKECGGKEYTKYEALQRQRKLETAMRAQRQKIHLLETGGAAEDDIITARCRYRATSQEYTRFSKAMGLPQQRERVTVDGLGNIGVGKTKIDLTQRDYNDIINMRGKMSDVDVRKWYISHSKNIPNLIDKSKSVEEQARQACELRNQYRFQARELMKDQKARKVLDQTDPIISFEELVSGKMSQKNLSREEAVKDTLKTAVKTRKSVNKKLGLED